MIYTSKLELDDLKDFDLKQTVECGQCFRWNDEMGDGSYIGVCGKYAARVKYHYEIIEFEISGGSLGRWVDYFDIVADYGEIKRKLIERDPKLQDAIEFGKGIRIMHQDMWEVIASFIISQNNNIPRIKGCIEALCEKFGEEIGDFYGKVRYMFPEASVIANCTEEDLADIKLGYRTEYLIEAAKRYVSEGLPAGDMDALRETLSQYKGIGPKVLNCIMLFGARDLSAFPVDVWVKRVMHDMYGFDENDTAGMQKYAAEHFGELSGYAQQYLFYYYREHGGEVE